MQATTPSLTKPPLLFNPETGTITERFKNMLDLVGLVSERVFPEYDAYHLLNVDALLQKKCYRLEWDYFKDGGAPAFKMRFEQAEKFLDLDCSAQIKMLPQYVSEPVDAIVCSGVYPHSLPATLSKRLHGLHTSIEEQNLYYDVVYVLCKNEEISRLSEKYIKENFQEKFHGVTFRYIAANVETEIGATGLKKLKESARKLKKYVVLSDPSFAEKDFLNALKILTENTCLGVAAVPMSDWKRLMELYNYDEKKLGGYKKMVKAFAYSQWNIKARSVNIEASAFKAKRLT